MALNDAYPTSSTTLTTMAQWEAFFRGMSASGIVAGVLNEFEPSLDTGARAAVMASGAAEIRGFHVDGPTPTATPIPDPSAQNRVDRLVLRLDRAAATAAGWITPVVIPGTPHATNPQPPPLIQGDIGTFDLPISRWTSTAAGSLANLVDERILKMGPPLVFFSWARPPAAIRRIGTEIDTGRTLRADGTAWVPITDDTGWVSLTPLTGPDKAAWTPNSVCRVRRVNETVHVRIAVKRWNSSALTLADADGSAPITLPAGFRPEIDELGGGFHSRSPVQLRVESTGHVRIFPLESDIPAGRTVQASAQFLIN
ncbi:hypothetical protein [Spirillospora sp. CA-294931]|uniref:hypothetical protein n=1 Tax=Spirillospora sp. CA-294931 TaxID=3240042 RepID=UPI003D913990